MDAIVHEYFSRLAAYNSWANARLYDAATALSDFERKRDIKAYFTSLHGTLNHILVADRIWLSRLTGADNSPKKLDETLYEDFSALRDARESEDKRIIDVVTSYLPEEFAKILDYKNTRGDAHALPIATILGHLFNHQTHHRGQASQLLSQLGVAKPPSLDILYFELPSA